jgi:flagellar hook-associated protein 1 FlgK
MSSLLSILDVARDGMTASSSALDVTGQNVSNASTPGYTRRVAQLETVPSNGAFGSVRVAGIGRTFDRFAEGRFTVEGGKHGAASARSAALGDAEAILAPSGSPGISDRLSAFYASMSKLGQNPVDPSTRASALGAAQDLAGSVSATATALADSRAGLYTKAQALAGDINTRLTHIADLNHQIAAAHAAGETPADLMDQRDTLVREVGERVGAQALDQPSGAVTVLSSGTALVDGDNAASIVVGTDANGALTVSLVHPGGATDDITANVTTGELGGIREARDVDLAKAQQQLDQFAFDFAGSVNAVHTTGYGLDGQTGRPLFTPPTGVAGAARALTVAAVVLQNPNAIATASSAADIPGGNDIAVAIAQLSEQPLGGAPTPSQAIASVAATLGSAKQGSDAELALREGTMAQAQSLRENASGVSLDEEMVNLTKFQRAFEASTKVLATVNELLDSLVKGF